MTLAQARNASATMHGHQLLVVPLAGAPFPAGVWFPATRGDLELELTHVRANALLLAYGLPANMSMTAAALIAKRRAIAEQIGVRMLYDITEGKAERTCRR